MPTQMDSLLSWAASAVGAGARVVDVRGLRESSNPWLLRIELAGRSIEVVLRVTRRLWSDALATQASALVFAEERGLAAPRLIAIDPDGDAAGAPALLETVLPGSSEIPAQASGERLRGLGIAAAALHTIPMSPDAHLPLRTRPIPHDDYAMERRWAKRFQAASENRKTAILDELCALTSWPHDRARKVLRETTSTPLLESADEVLGRAPAPEGETVFVHGDLWQGNTLWVGESFAGMVDWDSAGAGHYGVDLGSLRLDAALHFGPHAPATVLDGWHEATGREPDNGAYWDVVAALNTPADLSAFVSASHKNGRPDLDAATMNERRDSFLRAALDRLDREGVTYE